MPRAMSRPREPVETTGTSLTTPPSPSFMIAPLPNCLSIWLTARSIALSRFASIFTLLNPVVRLVLFRQVYDLQWVVDSSFAFELALEKNHFCHRGFTEFMTLPSFKFFSEFCRWSVILPPTPDSQV